MKNKKNCPAFHRALFIKTDIFILITICLILIAAVCVFSGNDEAASYYVISIENVEVRRGSLDKDIVFDLEGASFEVCDGEIFIRNTDCKNKSCIHTGGISNRLESIACLPKKLVVSIVGSDNNSADLIIG